jgi:FkbM family methyltransferase
MTRSYTIKPLMSIDETKSLEGKFIDNFDTIIDHDADVYYIEGGKKHLLFHFRKNVIPTDMLNNAIKIFKKDAVKASSIRGKAAGVVQPNKISPNIDHMVSKDRFRSRVVFKDGTESKYYVSNKVNSLLAGYFDKPTLAKKHEVLTDGLVPCRTTAFTEKNTAQWNTVLPLLQLCDNHYETLEPKTHKKQLDLATITPEFQIDETAFSTLTVNYNWRTACHVDAGDFREGYSVIMVAAEGQYEGGFLGYPRFGVCVDVRHGDFLLKDPHQYHCNTALKGVSKDWTRLSMVLYYRENMQKCYQPQIQKGHRQQKGGFTNEIVRVNLPKRNLDLELYIRPETTDIKVIKEVLETNVYEKQKLGFFVQEGEHWLDLGGNIGTFALLALSHGASVVTCEPEHDNLELLQKNLEHNFPNGDYEILPVAVTTDANATVDLYLCKGEYNKYRHTIHPKRGRSSVKVQQKHIHDLLAEHDFDCIKMDIEGAEIDILETLTPEDYQQYGIKKMVFEYSFDIDPSIPRFLAIVDNLRLYFDEVSYSKVKENELEYKHFPAMTMVYCIL